MKLANWFRMVMAAAPLAAAGTTCITDVMLVGGNESERDALKTTYEAQGWTRIDNDLNATCGSDSDYIHLFVKSADSGSATNGVITGFYLLNSPSNYTDTITHDGRIYRLTPYDGGTHFKQLKGDLNSNTKGDTIHLYYTKAAFTDGRAVTDITFDGNSAACNMIQEARNGREKCRIYLNTRSRGLAAKAKLLEGYVRFMQDAETILRRLKMMKDNGIKTAYFFVSDLAGNIYYAETQRGHEKNKA